jgi:FkbM family methyltransferase
MTLRRAVIRALDRAGGRRILGTVIGSMARQHATDVQVYFRHGMWMHKTGDYVFVDSPTLDYHPSTFRTWPDEAEWRCRNTHDHWFHVYKSCTGDIILDVGAGKGEDALAFSRAVGPDGRVICVEAHPTIFRCLRLFCEMNNLLNITPVNYAIVDTLGPVAINATADWQANSIGNAGGANSVSVAGITLDELVKQESIPRIDFLKMNIEGAEAAAIRGMGESLRITRALCISCHDFRADYGDGEYFRTKAVVQNAVRNAGFKILSRDLDPRRYIADQVNAIRE